MSQHAANYASHEGTLRTCLIELFPGEKILVNTQKDHEFKHTDTGEYMQLDISLPNLDLCFEFQDAYHYVTFWYNMLTLKQIKQRDNTKQTVLRQNCISLLTVPCWWDGTTESLSNTIGYHRPDLLPENSSDLIPLNPPFNYFITLDVPNVSELMLASFAEENFSPAPFEWWIGEKYDGVRCYWDPRTQVAYSRNGKEINILAAMQHELPKLTIDCELWYGRGQYSLSYAMVSKASFFSWDFLRMVAFDALPLTSLETPFEERYDDLTTKIPNNHPFVTVTFRVLCIGLNHLRTFADEIIQNGGGEGLICRRVASHYEPGRSSSLLKLKTALGDQEAIVVGIEEDGSLELKLPNGMTFAVPRDDVHVPRPSLGDIVSFSYDVKTRHDIPTRPSVFRIRTDIEWDDVINGARSDRHRSSDVFQTKPLYYWTEVNLRKHLEQFARSLHLDPLEASTWYTINSTKLRDVKGGGSIADVLRRGGFHKNIRALFPEVDFQDDTFADLQDASARRAFFVSYARKKGFDPLIPDNWYHQVKTSVGAEKGGWAVLYSHGNVLKNALMALFPEIGLDISKFNTHKWKEESKRRAVLEDFAKANHFDPLKAEHWEAVSHERIFKFSSAANSILRIYYNNSLRTAVMALFPEIDHLYQTGISRKHRQERKAFLVNYAREKGFDPLIPDNWYHQGNIPAEQGGRTVLIRPYRLKDELPVLFPNIGLDRSKFRTHGNWKEESRRRAVLEDFATANHFDPLKAEHWESVSHERIFKLAAARYIIITYYNGSVRTAVTTLFPEIGHLDPRRAAWKQRHEMRAFFETFAKKRRFDPLVTEQWYKQSAAEMYTEKGSAEVIKYYGKDHRLALIDLFPAIGLKYSQFPTSKRIVPRGARCKS